MTISISVGRADQLVMLHHAMMFMQTELKQCGKIAEPGDGTALLCDKSKGHAGGCSWLAEVIETQAGWELAIQPLTP